MRMVDASTAPGVPAPNDAHHRLRAIREDRGLTQMQLAVQAGVGIASVQRLEKGDPSVGWGIAAKVGEALSVDPTAFYSGYDLPASLRKQAGEAIAAPEWARDLGRKLDHIIDLLEHRR